MKIALINGSPKFKESGSVRLLDIVKAAAGCAGTSDFIEIQFRKPATPTEEELAKLADADAWVFSFPLYVDGVPGHLLYVLKMLEQTGLYNPQRRIYGICNCGFYEGEQNEHALDILRNWAVKCGYIWGGAVGVGGGGATLSLTSMGPVGNFLMKPVNKALYNLGKTVAEGSCQDNTYVSIALPRAIYQFCAHDGWKKKIKANGGKVEDLEKRF